tara:strand:+ start:3885 stop:4073 length:189 start_codon:yes stop_codon:yes gene_type:complete
MYVEAEALAFWKGVCAGIIACRYDELFLAWVETFADPYAREHLRYRFWLCVSLLQEAEGWLK